MMDHTISDTVSIPISKTAYYRQQGQTCSILRFLQEEALVLFPAFPEAFGQLVQEPCESLDAPLGTDGIHLFFHPELLLQNFLEDSAHLRKSYLHVHIHCLCLHLIQGSRTDPARWDLACDLTTELLAAHLSRDEESMTLLRKFAALTGKTAIAPFNPAAILSLFDSCPELPGLAGTCARDSHQFWFRNLYQPDAKTIGSDSTSREASALHAHLNHSQLDYLETIRRHWENKMPKLLTAAEGQRNGRGGTASEEADLQPNDNMDYRKFLRQFAVPREEPLLDMDSFDYIPYCYGLECYADEIRTYAAQSRCASCNQPVARSISFLEPLEYSEVNRLDELAIAIDTSGSCSGRIVQRFLEETWSILRQRENFFSRMRLHLIQCDSMIQEHRIFTGVEEWEASLSDIRILGHGNTDFRPVFDYLNKLIHEKEIRHLRGLLYFTDGDGIFPDSPPQWDTAFVFLNNQTEKHAIPGWAIRLNLHLPDEF